MANISSYTSDATIDLLDKVIGTDGTIGADQGKTKNFTVSALKNFIAGSQVVTIKKTITPSQLLSLNGGGNLELIEAPGAGKVIVPISFTGFLDYAETTYVSSSDSNIKIRSAQTGTFGDIPRNTIESTSDKYFTISIAGQSLEANGNINFTTDNSFVLTTGNSPLTVSISYLIVDFS